MVPLPGDRRQVEQMAGFFGALGDPECIRLIEFLAQGERTTSECVAHTCLPPDAVCAHLAMLRDRGWIMAHHQDSYRLADPRATELVLLARILAQNNVGALVQCNHLGQSAP